MFIRNSILAILVVCSFNVSAQRVPARDACISYYDYAAMYVNNAVGELVEMRLLGLIDYQFFIKWQNKIIRESEYPLFKINQQSYDENDKACLGYMQEVVDNTNIILSDALLDAER